MDTHYLSHAPGDTVRDRKTGKDYVIHTITALAGVGGLLVYGINVFNRQLEEFRVVNYTDMTDKFLTIKDNKSNKTPQQVLDTLTEHIENTLGASQELIERLELPENKVFRDLIYATSETSDKTFQQGLLDVAAAVVHPSKGMPSREAIKGFLRNAGEQSGVSEEFLEQLTDQLVSATRSAEMIRTQYPRNLTPDANFLIQEYTRGPRFGDLGIVKKYGLAHMDPRRNKFISPMSKENDILHLIMGDLEFERFKLHGIPFFEDLSQHTATTRTRKVVDEMIRVLGGSNSKLLNAHLDTSVERAVKAYRRGELTELSQFILRLFDADSQEFKHLGNHARNLVANLERDPTRRYIKYPYLAAQQYVKKNSVTGLPSVQSTRKGVNFTDIVNPQKFRPHKGNEAIVSVDIPTFMDQLISDRKVTLTGNLKDTVNLADMNSSRAVRAELEKNNRVSIIMKQSQLAELMREVESGETVNLKRYTDISDKIHSQLPTDNLVDLQSMHGSVSGGRFRHNRERVAIGYYEGELATEPYSLAASVLQNDALTKEQRIMGGIGAEPVRPNQARVFKITDNQGNVHASLSLENLDEHVRNLNQNQPEFKYPGIGENVITYHDIETTQAAQLNLSEAAKQIDSNVVAKLGPAKKVVTTQQAARNVEFNPSTLEGSLNIIMNEHKAGRNIGAKLGHMRFRKPEGIESTAVTSVKNQKIAIAHIKKPGQNTTTKIIGSDLGNIQQQIDLANQLLTSNKVALIDIETRNMGAMKTSRRSLFEVHLGEFKGGDLLDVIHERGLRSEIHRADTIIELAEKLSNYDVIASHTDYDPRTLIQEARILQEKVPAKANQLEVAIGKISKAVETKWLDLQVFHQVAGSQLGDLSQGSLTHKFLPGRVEAHTARQDNLDQFHLIHKRRMDYLENVEGITLTKGEVKHLNQMYFEGNTLSPNAGKIRKLMGLHTTSEGIVAQWQEFNSIMEDGVPKLHGTGFSYDEVYSNANVFGGAINRATPVDPANWSQYADQWLERMNDASGRRARTVLNPFTKSIRDTAGGFVAGAENFSALKFKVDKTAANLFNQANESFAAIHSKWLENNSPTMESVIEHMELAAERIVQRHAAESGDLFQINLRKQLVDMMLSPTEAAALMDTQKSQYARLLQSTLGAQLDAAATADLGGKRHSFDILLMVLNKNAAATEAISKSSLTKVNQYTSRLSFGLLSERAHVSLTRGTADIDKIGASISNVITENILKITDEPGQGPIHDLMNRHGIDADVLREQVEKYREANGVSRYGARDEWKMALMDIPLRHREDPDFGEMVKARDVLFHGEETKTMIEGAMHEVKENHRQLLELTGEEEHLKRLAMVEEVHRDFAETLEVSATPVEALQLAAQRAINKDAEGFASAFSRSYEQKDVDKLIDMYQGEKLGEVTRDAQDIMDQVFGAGHLTERDLEDAIELGFKRQSDAWNAGVRGIERDSIMGDTVISELMRVSNAARAAMSQNSTESEQEVMQRLITTGGRVAGTESGDLMRTQHAMVLGEGAPGAANAFKKVSLPLLAIAGAAALMAAKEPDNDGFSQGQKSDRLGWFNHYAKYSEIPGSAPLHTVWHGESDPFRLDITFSGFIQSKDHHDALVSQVFDSISGSVEFQKKQTSVNDYRNKNHRETARRVLERNL
jgi:hypothetical protein